VIITKAFKAVPKRDFTSGTIANADVINGADGHRSKVRPYVTDVKVLYSGVAIIQGEIDQPARPVLKYMSW